LRAHGNGGNVNEKEEKIYFGNYEVKKLMQVSTEKETLLLHRQTLRVMDGTTCVAILHYWVKDDRKREDKNAGDLSLRFQLDNHLGSVSMELDKNALLLSYEEYFPYGGTAFMAGNNQTEVALKDYRYSGKERDDSTGLYYYGARYYAPWLGRWLCPDPAGTVDGLNLYAFVAGNPVYYSDHFGTSKIPLRLVPKDYRPSKPLNYSGTTYQLFQFKNSNYNFPFNRWSNTTFFQSWRNNAIISRRFYFNNILNLFNKKSAKTNTKITEKSIKEWIEMDTTKIFTHTTTRENLKKIIETGIIKTGNIFGTKNQNIHVSPLIAGINTKAEFAGMLSGGFTNQNPKLEAFIEFKNFPKDFFIEFKGTNSYDKKFEGPNNWIINPKYIKKGEVDISEYIHRSGDLIDRYGNSFGDIPKNPTKGD
jgi:RHS repeat-associated protein